MAESTVLQFAKELGLPTALLLMQLKSAGVNKTNVDDPLYETDKTALMDYLRKEHGAAQAPKKKIKLIRKQNAEIKQTDPVDKRRMIQVERVSIGNDDIIEIPKPITEENIRDALKPKSRSDDRKVRIEGYLSKARSFLPDHTDEALNIVRKANEAIIIDIIEFISENSGIINKFKSFEDQLSYIKRTINLPKRIDYLFKTLQTFGNLASHHQEDDPTPLSINIVESNLIMLNELIDWHKNQNFSQMTKNID